MKLVIFTPGRKVSAIGRVAALVCEQLARQGHSFELVFTENGDGLVGAHRNFGAPGYHWTDRPKVEAALAGADVIVHHVGDNYEFHRGSVEWLPAARGIICLHDFFLASLFWGWSAGRRATASAIIERLYGRHAADNFFSYRDPARFVEGTHLQSPMTEWVADLADAVVVHSSWGIDRVLSSCAGPVRMVPLPYDIRAAGPQKEPRAVDRDVLLTVGHINRNKRPESVILAIGSSPALRNRVIYQLIGSIDRVFAEELRLLARRADVMLDIRGSVEDSVLDAAIHEAHIMVCLRRPVLESASASVIEAMLHGKATVVSDAGFCRDIPDVCVAKVGAEREVAELRSILETLHRDAAKRQELGIRARSWAEQTFVASNYADALIDIAREVIATRPAAGMLRHFSDIAVRWSSDPATVLNADALRPIEILNSI